MKFKAFCFSLSRPLIKENLRRFWPISVIGFLVYFLSGVFPILLSYKNLADMSYYIEEMLQNENPFFCIAHLTLPILTAVVIFRYLQNVSSVAVMHAMPFQRITLYCSHFLSGFILITLPILANGCILLAISKPIVPYDYNVMYDDLQNVFSRMSILNWIWQSLLILLFLYVIAVFAGIITGNSLMHFCSAVAFNFLIPSLYGVLLVYFHQYLFGFSTQSGEQLIYNLSPFLTIFNAQKAFTLTQSIAYLFVILVLFVLSAFLYEKRKLEKAGDSLVYSFLEPIICYLIAFFTMTLLGVYFNFLGDNSSIYRYIGYLSGALLGFLIGRMVVKKTIRIFDFPSFKSFGIYALIAAAFFICLEFDFTGYEKRIPIKSNIKEISMDYALNDFSQGANNFKNNEEIITHYKNEQNIASILKFHKQMIVNKEKIQENLETGHERYASINLKYKTKSGRTVTRFYEVPYWLILKNENLQALYESKEFRSNLKLTQVKANDLQEIMINSKVSSTIQSSIASQDLANLVKALNQDIKALTYEQLSSFKIPICTIEIDYTDRSLPKNKSATGETIYETTIEEYVIHSYYTNTIAWLKAHGYEMYTDYMKKKPLYAVGIHYTEETYQKTNSVADAYYDLKLEPPQSQENTIVITDLAKIEQLYKLGSTIQFDDNDYYAIQVVYEGNNGEAVPTELYLNNTNVPEYILDYFR